MTEKVEQQLCQILMGADPNVSDEIVEQLIETRFAYIGHSIEESVAGDHMARIRDRARSRVKRGLFASMRHFLADRMPHVIGGVEAVAGTPLMYRVGRSRPVLLRAGMRVPNGSSIETGDFDWVLIHFNDGTKLRLDFNTFLDLGRTTRGASRPSKVFLSCGSLMASVVHTAKEELFRVRTMAATAEVLGTTFSLALSRNSGQAILKVQEGMVAFYNGHGRVVAEAEMESTAKEDTAPTEPRPTSVFDFYLLDKGTITMITPPLAIMGALNVRLVYPGKPGVHVPQHPRLGEEGLSVAAITRNSVADSAGLRIRDLILEIDHRKVVRDVDLLVPLAREFDKQHVLTVKRGSEILDVPVEALKAPVPEGVSPRVWPKLIRSTRLLFEGKVDEAIQQLEKLSRSTKEAAAFNNLGVAHELRGEPVQAGEAYMKAVGRCPSGMVYRRNLSHLLSFVENHDRAREEMLLCYQLDPSLDINAYYVALTHLRCGLQNEAIQFLDGALERHPDSVRLWSAKTDIFLKTQRNDEAIYCAKRAIELDPLGTRDSNGARIMLSLALTEQGKEEESERVMWEAWRFDPEQIMTTYLAYVLQLRGKHEEAITLLNHERIFDPTAYNVLLNLARSLSALNRNEEAEQTYRCCIDAHPRAPWPVDELALHLSKLEDRMTEALGLSDRALAVRPDEPDFLTTRGRILLRLNHIDEAEAILRQAIERYEGRNRAKEPYLHLGRLLEQREDRVAAVECYHKALELAPENQDAKDALSRLGG